MASIGTLNVKIKMKRKWPLYVVGIPCALFRLDLPNWLMRLCFSYEVGHG